MYSESQYAREIREAMRIAQQAGNLLQSRLASNVKISRKGETDLVTEMDLAAEDLIRKAIQLTFPGDKILAEEGGGPLIENDRIWVVDPLDGTTNYAQGIDHYSVSIALVERGKSRVGVVLKPASNELFSAVEGCGAYCNSKKIQVSDKTKLQDAVVVTGFPYVRDDCLEQLLRQLAYFLPVVRGVRRFGSAALDLCYIAAGRFDLYYENRLHIWDVAAGQLIVQEAGGRVSNFSGDPMSMHAPEVLASNGQLHQLAISLLENR